MSRLDSVELEGEDKDSRQLILLLKGVIAEQQLKIAELEKDLKKWEKRYKEEFFKDSSYSNNYEKHHKSDALSLNFSKELFLLQTKYDKKAANSFRNGSVNQSLRQGIELIQSLYEELASIKQEQKSKISLIDQQGAQIKKCKRQLEAYLQQYAITVKKSEEYEEKLLAEIKRQQTVINRLKQ